MKRIAQALWNEPAAVLGIVSAVVVYLVTGDLLAALAPLVQGFGTRQFVQPIDPPKGIQE